MLKKVLMFAAAAEALTGLALLTVPSLAGWLLLGEGLAGAAIPVARVAGIALIALAVSCWPGPPLAGMSIYNIGVTFYLSYFGVTSGTGGILLWPAVVLHFGLSVLLGRLWMGGHRRLRDGKK